MKEVKLISVLEQVKQKQLTIRAAAQELGLSTRQVQRVMRRYHLEGEQGVLSNRRGRPNCRKIPQEIEGAAMAALRDPLYEGFGPTFAKEKLASRHQIFVSVETARKWMIVHDLWQSRQKKEKKIYPRRSRFGELLQGNTE